MNGETNAEASPLEILNNLIFENSEKMPNGLYLELMNQTKKIFDLEEEKKKKDGFFNQINKFYTHFILVFNPTHYLLTKISLDRHYILFYNNQKYINMAREGRLLRLTTIKKNYLFIQILKLNKLSFRYNIIKFKNINYDIPPNEREKPRIIKNRLLYFGNNKDLEHLNFYILDEKPEQTKKIFDELKLLTNSYYINTNNNNFIEVDKIKHLNI